MDLALFTRNRLKQLRLRPLDLARASSMAESNIADLLDPNSLQTASKRTHVHDQLERVLPGAWRSGSFFMLVPLAQRQTDRTCPALLPVS
jgi:hypothetical protein